MHPHEPQPDPHQPPMHPHEAPLNPHEPQMHPHEQTMDPPPPPEKRGRGRARAGRIFRGYLMTAGALATIYALIRLVVLLFVELNKWMP